MESWEETDDFEANAQRVEVISRDQTSARRSYAWVDVFGNTKKQTDPAGGVTTYQYDSKGVLKSMKTPGDQAAQTPSEEYTYDYRGEALTVKNAEGNTAQTVYDYLGRAVRTTDFSGNPTDTSYHLSGQKATVSTALGENANSLIQYYYDRNGNLALEKVQTNEPGAETAAYREIRYGYDSHNRLDYTKQTEDDSTDTYTKYFYDKKNNPVRVVTGLSALTGVTEQAAPEGAAVTAYEYHPYLNTVSKMTLPDGTVQYYEYNYWNQVEEQGYLDHANQPYGVVESAYNAIGELVSQTGENGEENSYTYNRYGDVTAVTDATGTTWTFEMPLQEK